MPYSPMNANHLINKLHLSVRRARPQVQNYSKFCALFLYLMNNAIMLHRADKKTAVHQEGNIFFINFEISGLNTNF